ncbi:MAG: DMT family transporter [Pseudomonadota bacterium]
MRLTAPSTGFASLTVFVSASLWGLYWIPLRYLEDLGVAPGWAIVLTTAPAALVLGVIALWQWPRTRPHLRHALLIGALTGTGLALYGLGLIYSSVVRATLLFYLMPVWGTLIGMAWLGERANWRRWAAIAAGLVGLALLMSGGGSVPLNVGDLFGLLSGIFWSTGAAAIMRFDKVPVPGMTALQFAMTALVAIGVGAMVGTEAFPTVEILTTALPVGTAVAVLGFIPAVVVLFWAQKFLFPGRVGLLMMTEVITAVLTASIFLPEETMSSIQWAGAALVVGACLLEVMGSEAEPKPEAG